MTRVVRRGAALATALAVLAMGCGGDDGDAESAVTDAPFWPSIFTHFLACGSPSLPGIGTMKVGLAQDRPQTVLARKDASSASETPLRHPLPDQAWAPPRGC